MSDAKRMHALMIGQPHFGAAVPAAKAKRGRDGRFEKKAAPPAEPEAAAPKAGGEYEQQLEDVKSKMLDDYEGRSRR